MILSSARYLLAFAQGTIDLEVENSSLAPRRKVFKGSPLIQFHLKDENAPGSTDTNPKRLSVALSR